MLIELRYAIEQIIRDHIAQDVDFDNAVVEASREIAAMVEREVVEPIEHTLTVPAAEYVPAIGDVFEIIDKMRRP